MYLYVLCINYKKSLCGDWAGTGLCQVDGVRGVETEDQHVCLWAMTITTCLFVIKRPLWASNDSIQWACCRQPTCPMQCWATPRPYCLWLHNNAPHCVCHSHKVTLLHVNHLQCGAAPNMPGSLMRAHWQSSFTHVYNVLRQFFHGQTLLIPILQLFATLRGLKLDINSAKIQRASVAAVIYVKNLFSVQTFAGRAVSSPCLEQPHNRVCHTYIIACQA